MNAIILAAGHGARMVASGHVIHKPLLPILGTPNIERIILMLKDIGIDDIVIVCGTYAKQYQYLQKKYDCSIISDPNTSLSTLYAIYSIIDKLNNTFIIEGDVVLAENIFEVKPYSYYYVMKYPSCEFDAWKPITNDSGRIISFKIGCFSDPCIFGISFWSQKDTDYIKKYFEKICTPENLNNGNKFWDDYFINILTDVEIFTKEIAFDSACEMNTGDEYNQALILCKNYYSNPNKYFLNLHNLDSNLTFEINIELAIKYTKKLFADYNSKHSDDLLDLNQEIHFDSNEYVYIIKKDNVPIAFVDLVFDTKYIFLRRFYVDISFRNHSIGTKIATKIITFSKLINKELRVNVYDEDAARFYERLGFKHNFVNYILRST